MKSLAVVALLGLAVTLAPPDLDACDRCTRKTYCFEFPECEIYEFCETKGVRLFENCAVSHLTGCLTWGDFCFVA